MSADVAPPLYPVNLVLDGKPCLVVGAGRVAARKIQGLLRCGAVVRVVATRVSEEVAALEAQGRVAVERRPYRTGEVAGYRLVVTATDDRTVNAAVFADGEAAGVWVNAADDPASCSAVLPAVVRRGPITVAVGTGGASPALASWLRAKFEAEVGPEYEVVAALLAEARAEIHADGRSTEGLDWHSALDSDMLDLVRAGEITKARERLQACLSSS